MPRRGGRPVWVKMWSTASCALQKRSAIGAPLRLVQASVAAIGGDGSEASGCINASMDLGPKILLLKGLGMGVRLYGLYQLVWSASCALLKISAMSAPTFGS